MTLPHFRMQSKASWLALATIDAFFSWTEHVFIHIAILRGNITTGPQLKKMVVGEWKEKYKHAIDISNAEAKQHLDKLVSLKNQLRNFVAHGAFGREGEAFDFHSGAGAVPVILQHNSSNVQFSLTQELAFDDEEAIETIENFINYLWSGEREAAWVYIQEHTLPIFLPKASDGTYSSAMSSVDDMREFIEYLEREMDRSANMDW